MRIFSYGGGVQSTAVLVLAAQGKVQYDHFLFSNVGEDSEHPDTLEYFRNVALPFAKEHGLDLIELRKYRRGKLHTVRELIFDDTKTVPIPIKMQTGAPGNRLCTYRFKIRVVDRWVKDHINGSENYIVGLGISEDEIHRAKTIEPEETYKGLWKEIEYPLLDLRLKRKHCRQIVIDAGLPSPPKSACYFCPLQNDLNWHELRQYYPSLFTDAVNVEQRLQEKRQSMGKDAVWMHRKLIPLNKAIPDQPFLFDLDNMDNCESGYCFT